MVSLQNYHKPVLPAGAGVILRESVGYIQLESAPRRRGGDP